jgi:hypothetical protein
VYRIGWPGHHPFQTVSQVKPLQLGELAQFFGQLRQLVARQVEFPEVAQGCEFRRKIEVVQLFVRTVAAAILSVCLCLRPGRDLLNEALDDRGV